jgi:hypothetical protein
MVNLNGLTQQVVQYPLLCATVLDLLHVTFYYRGQIHFNMLIIYNFPILFQLYWCQSKSGSHPSPILFSK